MRWVLDERTGLDVGIAPVLAAFAAQRTRFLRLVSALDARQWQAQSRCVDWSVHQVVRHVRDVAAYHVAKLAGLPSPFGEAKPFDPASTPDEWLTFSDSESPSQTVTELSRLVVEEARLLKALAERPPDRPYTGPLRRQLNWSIRSVHSFWDAWTHERDLSAALVVTPAYDPDELRLATMYSLMAAAAPAAWSADYVRTVVSLEDSPDGRYEISEEDGSVRVISATDSPAELAGPADHVLGSLSGRGPQLRELLSGPPAQREKLALLRAVAT
jgi:uncharacterized protein (TIGR03083 family)